jgi:hypothetical protein
MSALLCYHFLCTAFMMMRGELELVRSSTRHDQGTLVLFSALRALVDGILSKVYSMIMPRNHHIDVGRRSIPVGWDLLQSESRVEITKKWRNIALISHHNPKQHHRSDLTAQSSQTGPRAHCGNPESTYPKTRNPQSQT